MSDSFKSISLSAALIVSAVVSLPTASLAQTGPSSTDSMTVVRDAETGQLRAPTATEVNALQLKPARTNNLRVAPAATQQKFHSSGARGVRLTDDHMSHSVVVRKADGSLQEQCFSDKSAAEAAVRSAVATQLVTE